MTTAETVLKSSIVDGFPSLTCFMRVVTAAEDAGGIYESRDTHEAVAGLITFPDGSALGVRSADLDSAWIEA